MKENKGFKSGFVGIIGRPNVGKSTLLNHLVSEKLAAISDKPQTTRNKITGVCHFPNGQMVLMDTPGIHKASSKLNRYMVKTSTSTFSDVDVILFVIDAQEGFIDEDAYVLNLLKNATGAKVLVVNKVDLVPKPQILPLIDQLSKREEFAGIVPISALHEDGLDSLVNTVLDLFPEGPQYFPPDMVTDCPEKFLIQEIIREKIIRLTRLEIPYAVAVIVESLQEGHKGVIVIEATVYAEKDSQKKILIGVKGSMLKKVGSQARVEIEKRLGGKVYLNLFVKVKAKWRENERYLREFGYTHDSY